MEADEDTCTITKEEHFWTSEEKLKHCGYGEWVEEPDIVAFQYHGYEAFVARVFKREPYTEEEAYSGGHLCGYVRIPHGHPYFRKWDKSFDIDCHGGITFNEAHEEHYIGFDCSHSGDYVPTLEHFMRSSPEIIARRKAFPIPERLQGLSMFNPLYRNIQFCVDQCVDMIDQLVDIAKATK